MLGFEEHEIEASLEEWEKRVNPEQLEKVYQDIQSHLNGEIPLYKNEHQVLCKNGAYKWILDRGIIVERDMDGNPLRMIGTHTDIDLNKKLLEAINSANIKFSSLFEYSQDAILLVNFETKKIDDINPKAIELYGYTKNEFLNLKANDLDIIHDDEKVDKVQNEILENGWARFETKHKLNDGSIIDVLVNSTFVELDGKPFLYVTIKDITTEKLLQKQIESEKDFISTIIDNANAIIATIDSNGRMFKINKYAQNFLGFSEEEVSSEPYFWSRFLPEDKKDKVINIIEKAKEGEIVESFKNSWFSKDGEEKVFEWSNTLVQNEDGSMNYLATIGIDITEKEEVLKRIVHQKEEFETVFNYAQDGIIILDFESNILDCNNSFSQMLDYTKDELLKIKGFTLSNDENTEDKKKQLLKDGHLDNYEKTIIGRDNKQIVTNVSVSLLPDKKRLLAIVKDITQIKQAEDQLRLASMGELLGNIAHQWRQPLSVITTSASGLKFTYEFTGKLEKENLDFAVDKIVEQAKYLSQTIDDFRNFVREDKEFRQISIQNVISSSLNLLDSSLKNNFIKVVIKNSDDIKIYGNKNELQQALINILNNAKDFIKQNVKNDEDRYIFIDSKKINENELELKIIDTAGGIAEENIKKVFDPYFTTKHQSVGTGLGLSMTHKIITQRHEQKISVRNEKFDYNNKAYMGACFIILFKKINDL